ncbi:MAG: alpha-amylase family glycosyl hydrolase, partial [Acholeplasmataceae bacterium]
REFGLEVFEKHGVLTVGETIFVTPEEGLRYTATDRHELDMVFHFAHMGVDNINNKWFIIPFRPRRLKLILDQWQRGLEPNGWNALYLENHDQPRSLSRFGDDKKYREESAKMLSALLLLQRGTPFIYQGQEIGMSNARFEELSQYRDVETKNIYQIGRKRLKLSHRRMMKKIKYMSRDNARTPMQWDDTTFAGFSEKASWIDVNPNKDYVNVKAQEKNPHSILNFYRQLIEIRQSSQALKEGDYELYFKRHRRLYCFSRKSGDEMYLVLANYAKKATRFGMPKELKNYAFKLILSNYEHSSKDDITVLKPYEVRIYSKR